MSAGLQTPCVRCNVSPATSMSPLCARCLEVHGSELSDDEIRRAAVKEDEF